MHDADLVDVLYARDDLLIVLAGLVLLETLRLPDLLEQLVPAAVLHDQEEVLVVLYDLTKGEWRRDIYVEELNDIGVAKLLKDLDLAVNSLEV